MKIGIAGIGKMGAAIAQRLLSTGHSLSVWNRTPQKTRALAGAGAAVTATPAELAARSDTIITILTNAAAIDATYHGSDGLLAADVAGKLFVEMSTVRPATVTALGAQVRTKGAALVECPVGGSVGAAREGKLFGLVGGEARDVGRARPFLEHICRRVEHVGELGAGASMKLAINLPLLVYWQALGEALTLCQPVGLDPARLLDIFADTSGAPGMLRSRTPSIVAALEGRSPEPVSFDIDSVRKDLRTMLEEAQSLGATLPVVSRALECFDQASRRGFGSKDCALLPVAWAQPKI